MLLCTSTAFADTPPVKENLATAGDVALQSNDNNLAIEKYTAITQPGDETIYNLGIAHYRNGDLQQAANQFRMVIGSQNDSVAARSRFNLGNAFYSQALTKLNPPATDTATPTAAQPPTVTTPTTLSASQDPSASQDAEAGMKLLRSAITQYRSALRIDSDDTDARANIELAQSLIDEIEQQDQQQQDQQQQDQQQQDQQQQDQQQQQQQQDQQQQDQQQQDQQENTPDQKKLDSTDEVESENEGDDSSDPASGELTAVNEQGDASDQERGEPALVNTDQMTEEEARKLLQSIRDRDMLRRLRKQAAERALRVPVERDW
ncbi:hypothetical protein OAH22_00060 [bacterium]|nr:hypothetical protein [bacterium]